MDGTKKRLFAAARWVVLAALVGAAAWYAWEHPRLLAALGDVSPLALGVLLALMLLGRLCQGIQFRALCSVFDLELTFWEWFGLTVCKSMYGFLMPGRPGTALQAVYLKKKHGFAFTKFGSLFAATNVLNAVTAGVVGLAACGAEFLRGGPMPASVVLAAGFFLACSVGGALVFVLATGSVKFLPFERLRRLGLRVQEGVDLFLAHPGVLGWVAGLVAVRYLLAGLALFVAGRSVGLELNLMQGILMASLGSFGLFLPLTPGGIGISEGIISGVAELLGLSPELAMLGALVKRAAGVLTVFVIGPMAQHILTGKLSGDESGDEVLRPPGEGREE